MARNVPRLLLWLVPGSEAELGDVMEEHAEGRGTLWVWRQALSTVRVWRHHVTARQQPQERWTGMFSNLWSDVRYAVRTFRRNPGFTAAAVVPIALGIGINTGIFSILNAVALRPLPAPEANELVSIYQQFRGVQQRRVHGSRSMFSTAEYRSYRDSTQTLSGIMGYSMPWTVTLGGDSPREIDGVLVTCNYFDVLRLPVATGTGFTAANCEGPGALPAVVLSHDLWIRVFAADPRIAQKTITLNRQSFAVVGVAPDGFHGTDFLKAAFFAPVSTLAALRPDQDFYRDANTSWLSLLGRRKHEAGIAQVRAELEVIAKQIDQQQPGRTTTLTVAQATSLSLPEARQGILTVAAVVLAGFGLVLLIACANVANLLLARAAGRTKEIAVRLSVGASRGRLIQQLLTESVMLALAGGVAGSILAWWSFQGLLTVALSSLPGQIPSLSIDAHPNMSVMWFALALTVTTGLVFGLAPALQASKQDLQTGLKQDGAGSGRRTGGLLRGMLIGAQVTVCMLLLISAGLLMRGLYAAQTVEPGFDYRNVAVVSFEVPPQVVEVPLQVVGVAKDAQVSRVAETRSSYLYLPAVPREQPRLQLIVRSQVEFGSLGSGIRAAARDLDPTLVVRVNRLEENLDFWRTVSRLVATLSGSLSLLAFLLASVGVYGVVSYVVSRRLREVGIRMMLGASARDVQAMILGQTMRPVAIGVVIGIGAAAAASQILTSVLFGVSRFDPIAFIGAPLFLLGVAAAASLVPARPAMRVDPMTTLRYE